MPHDLEHSDQDDVSHRGGHDLRAHSRLTIEGFLSKLQFSWETSKPLRSWHLTSNSWIPVEQVAEHGKKPLRGWKFGKILLWTQIWIGQKEMTKNLTPNPDRSQW